MQNHQPTYFGCKVRRESESEVSALLWPAAPGWWYMADGTAAPQTPSAPPPSAWCVYDWSLCAPFLNHKNQFVNQSISSTFFIQTKVTNERKKSVSLWCWILLAGFECTRPQPAQYTVISIKRSSNWSPLACDEPATVYKGSVHGLINPRIMQIICYDPYGHQSNQSPLGDGDFGATC